MLKNIYQAITAFFTVQRIKKNNFMILISCKENGSELLNKTFASVGNLCSNNFISCCHYCEGSIFCRL